MRFTIAMRFVDTNILIYAISTLPAERAKAETTYEILQSSDCVLSVQVLQEFYVQVTRPTRAARLSHDEALTFLATLQRFPIQSMTPEVFQRATHVASVFQLSYWDAAIIAAAKALDCNVLLSEDVNAGQDYGGVRVVNPFGT